MPRTCFDCDNDIIVGKTLTESEMYKGLYEVEIHVRCRKCECKFEKMIRIIEEKKQLQKRCRELTKELNLLKA